MHRAKVLDLSQLELTSLPIQDIPEVFATFAGNKLGFTQPVLRYFYLKRATPLYYNAQDNGKFAREAFVAETNVYETLLKNPHPNIARYWGCHVVDGRIRVLVLSKYAMSLEERVKSGVPLDTKLCLQGIKDGIEHFHSLGLTHNDIN